MPGLRSEDDLDFEAGKTRLADSKTGARPGPRGADWESCVPAPYGPSRMMTHFLERPADDLFQADRSARKTVDKFSVEKIN